MFFRYNGFIDYFFVIYFCNQYFKLTLALIYCFVTFIKIINFYRSVFNMPFNIKSLRKEHGLTQQVLANALGVTQQSVHKYENNYIEPDIEALMTLADIFDTSIDYLVGYTDIKHKIEPTEKFDLNIAEKTFIQQFRKLSSQKRKVVIDLIEILI